MRYICGNHMHVALAAVHYHADVVDSNAVRAVIHIDVVAARFYVRVAAERAWEYIQDFLLSTGPRLGDNLPQTAGDVVSRPADRLALPVDHRRYRFKVFGKINEHGGVDDNGIAMRAANTILIISIQHFPVHPLSRQADYPRTCRPYICSTTHARLGKTVGYSASQPSRRSL